MRDRAPEHDDVFADDDLVVINGLDGATGDLLVPPLPVAQVARLAVGEPLDSAYLEELRARREPLGEAKLGTKAGVDATKLADAGWGIITAAADDRADDLRRRLEPLLQLRMEQAGARYVEYTGDRGYQPKETPTAFLKRHGVDWGPCDPHKIPYYLLIVGDPTTIPYTFEFNLGVVYAVGRLHFDDPDDYDRYAWSVVQAEDRKISRRSRTAIFFAPRAPGDRATQLSSDGLIAPLADAMASEFPAWSVERHIGDDERRPATKAALQEVLTSASRPALLFTAGHGVVFPPDDERHPNHQGALLCDDWPGPLQWLQPIPTRHYLSADDVADLGEQATLAGLIGFHFACFGAGTPRRDSFSRAVGKRPVIAAAPFVARLPQKLLAHPHGGTLAFVGHVDRALSCSFKWGTAGYQTAVFESVVHRLLSGHPVGSAMEFFPERYAALTANLDAVRSAADEDDHLLTPDRRELAGLWTAKTDARSYAIVGDPAVRLAVA